MASARGLREQSGQRQADASRIRRRPAPLTDLAPRATTTTAGHAPRPPRRRPDGTAHPPARHLHGALLRGPVHPAQQHPGAQGQLAGQQPEQPAGPSGGAQPDPGQHPVGRRRLLAQSVLGTGGQRLQVPAGLRPEHRPPSSPRSSGSTPSIYGNFRGIEAEYNSYLTPHTRPAKTLRDLLDQPDRGGQRDPDHRTRLQMPGGRGPRPATPRGSTGRPRWSSTPTTGAIEAMYSNPTYDPNPPGVRRTWPDRDSPPGTAYLGPARAARSVPGTYEQVYPPGSSFKVVTTSAVLEHRPDLAKMTYPVVSVTLPNSGTPPQMLTNYHDGDLRREPRGSCSSSPVTPTSPRSASCSGARPWPARPRPTGSTRPSPSTCPPTRWPSPTSATGAPTSPTTSPAS